jgi:hypothetical protein
MLGVLVTFSYGEEFDKQSVWNIATTSRGRFDGMPELHSKAFTINTELRKATNFYIWRSEQAAKDFFDDTLLQRVAGLYGVRPTVEFVQIAALVENSPS